MAASVYTPPLEASFDALSSTPYPLRSGYTPTRYSEKYETQRDWYIYETDHSMDADEPFSYCNDLAENDLLFPTNHAQYRYQPTAFSVKTGTEIKIHSPQPITPVSFERLHESLQSAYLPTCSYPPTPLQESSIKTALDVSGSCTPPISFSCAPGLSPLRQPLNLHLPQVSILSPQNPAAFSDQSLSITHRSSIDQAHTHSPPRNPYRPAEQAPFYPPLSMQSESQSHNLDPTQRIDRIFLCTLCSRKFRKANGLGLHLNAHRRSIARISSSAVATAQPGRANLSGTLSEDMPWEMQLYSTENLTAISSHRFTAEPMTSCPPSPTYPHISIPNPHDPSSSSHPPARPLSHSAPFDEVDGTQDARHSYRTYPDGSYSLSERHLV